MRKLIVVGLILVIGAAVVLLIKNSLPFSDHPNMISAEILIDSVWTFGPVAGFYENSTKTSYWLKSYTSLDQSKLDTLKNKRAEIKYLKFLQGPLENRISKMTIDSVVVFDQIIERE